MKPSPISVQKVLSELDRNGDLPVYNQCCTECRHAQGYMIWNESLKGVDGRVVRAEAIN